MHKKILIGLVLAALAVPEMCPAEQAVDLFNGKDLTGWVQRGGKAKYTVENGEIVGTTVLDTPNSFLCTEKTYGNFIFECDFKVDPRLNSGVQFRSECFDEPASVEWKGKMIKFPAGRVHGYQYEIDPDPAKDRWWTGGIYDEGRRLWLNPTKTGPDGKAFTDEGRKLFKQGDWNHVRIEAMGDSIKTYLNGILRTELKDSLTLRGFFGLQVHNIGKETDKAGIQVHYRNLKITELAATATAATNTLTDAEKAAGWQLLWDGKTTAGWLSAKSENFPANGWSMKDGVLTVHENGGEESADGGDIITRQRYTNFELMADLKITPGANSGIKYFVQPALSPIDKKTGQPTAVGSAIGLEFQILDDARHPDAKLGRDGDRTMGSLYDLIPAASSKQPNPIGEWNTAHIVVQGSHVEHWLNGQKVVEYERGSPAFRALVAQSKYKDIPGFGEWHDGHILLQEHGNDVSFQNIKIRELPAN